MSSRRPHILVVLTSHPHGWYLPELAHPFDALADHCDFTMASHAGGEAPLDASSIETFKDDEICSRFLLNHEDLWKKTVKLGDLAEQTDRFDAIFYVGGYGPMFDLVNSEASSSIIRKFYQEKKILSGICHGPAAFAHVTAPDTDRNILNGHQVTAISNRECELLFPQTGIVEPWSVEDALLAATQGNYEKAEPYNEKVITSKGPDGRTIITGQNPFSGRALGKAIYAELFPRAH